jgi:Integrase core domain
MIDVCREFGIARKTGYKILVHTRITGSPATFGCRPKGPSTPSSTVMAWSAAWAGSGTAPAARTSHRFCAAVRRARPATGDPFRRRPLRQPQRALQPAQARRLVAQTRHRDRTHQPGKPQQNGRHEGMHRRLKQEATRPPGMNSLQQQDRFNAFREEFDTERPHEPRELKLRDAGMMRIMANRRCAGAVSPAAPGGRACSPAAKKA